MITLTSSYLKTLDYADVELDSVSQTGSAVLSGALNCMTERKRLYMEFEVEEVGDPETEEQLELPNASIWVNFALFAPIGFAYSEAAGPPNTGFNFIIPPTEVGDESEMFFYSNGAIEPETCKNYRCWFNLLTATTFSLEFEFYNCFDENGYLNSTAKNNEYRFLAEMWNELNFNEINTSVYQTSKQIRVMTYIKHPVTNPAEVPYSEKQETVIYQGQSTSYNAESTFKQTDEVDADDLIILNATNDTEVFAFLASDEDTLTDFYAKLIRIQNNGVVDFIENAELSENKIEAGNPSVNAIKGPFTAAWNGADGYDLSFDVNAEYIENGAKYRLVIIGYDGSGDARLGVSGIMSGSGVVPYCQGNCEAYIETGAVILFTAGIKDLNTDWTGNELTCSIEERLRTYLIADYSDNRWKNNLDCRGIACGRTSITDNEIRRYLKAVTVDIYSEYNDTNLGGTVKNLLDRQVMQRTGVNTYYSPNIQFAFASDVLTMSYDFRVRNEDNIDCIQTLLNNVNYYPRQMSQYWAVSPGNPGAPADLFIKWRLTFEYHDCNPVWQDHLDIIQKLHVKDYQKVSIDGSSQICTSGINCFNANIFGTLADFDEYRLINTIEKMPVHGGLEESENWVPAILAQQQSTKFSSQDEFYDATSGLAEFCIDASELEEGQSYTITALAKKIIP